MAEFKNILYPIALTDISPKVVPYVVTMAKQLDAQVHLLHVLRRFDWFVDTYVADPPKPDFKRIASDFESQVMQQAQQKLEAFKRRRAGELRKRQSNPGRHRRAIQRQSPIAAPAGYYHGAGVSKNSGCPGHCDRHFGSRCFGGDFPGKHLRQPAVCGLWWLHQHQRCRSSRQPVDQRRF